jgi:Protein of unknown function (DUF3108)
LGRIGAAALAFLSASALAPTHATGAALDLEYDAFVLGFPALTFDFRLDQSEAAYHVAGSAHTNGIADMVVSYHLMTHTDGRVIAGKLQPTEEVSQSRRNGVEHMMQLDYDGTTVHARLTPAPDRMAPAAQIAGTVDPASATLAAGRVLAATGRCDQRIKVFDGHQRYDLVLSDAGEARLEHGLGIYNGAAHRCRLDLIKIDETLHEESQTKNGPAVVWFASLEPLLPPVPVQIDFTSHWGAATVALTRVQPVASVAGARP